MKANKMKPIFRHSRLMLLGIAIAATTTFTACTDDDNNSNNGNGDGPTAEVITFDDLDFFQNAIIEVDSVGDMMNRSYGVILDEAEPEHLYIGVDNLAQAETLFRQWLAPDVQTTADIPVNGSLTCPLTDREGNSQGTIYFTPGNGASVAEVTASAGTGLKHFNKITFLSNDAWPTNDEDEPVFFHEGDIITHTLSFALDEGELFHYRITDRDRTLKFVCMRQASKGVKPLFCAITNDGYERPISEEIAKSDYCPGEGKAKAISSILSKSWDFYADCFDKAGCGKLKKGQAYWLDKRHNNFFPFYDYMYYESGAIYGASSNEFPLPYLLKIDWLDDSALRCPLTATAGSAGVRGDEGYKSAFDGETCTKWCTHTSQKQNGAWVVEFQAKELINPKAVKIVTANDAAKYKGRNPGRWRLLAKGDLSEEKWTFLCGTGDIYRMANINCKEYWFTILPQNRDIYKYFRLEIQENQGADVLSVAEIGFILD